MYTAKKTPQIIMIKGSQIQLHTHVKYQITTNRLDLKSLFVII